MIERIIEGCIRNKMMVIILTLAVVAGGIYAVMNIPLDALPDLSDVQVIIFTSYPGQAPQVVEDQVTYPLTTKMLAVPYSKTVRGYSFFGFSFVYVIFEDGTDLYWARSRVLEYLSGIQGSLPAEARAELGPDATGVGWVYEYALRSDRHNLQELRSIQDWYLRYELTSVEGVAEIASVGGYVKQYQVTIDPIKLRSYDIPLSRVVHAIKRSNNDVGGRLVEMAETEFMVRGLGYIKEVADLQNVPVGVGSGGTPILLKDIAEIGLGPELRRGLIELNGEGEVAGGVVVMRLGENALDTINRVKAKLEALKAGLPEGVEIVPVYDRSTLIEHAIEVLGKKITEEMIVVALVCFLFLLHFRSAFVAIFTLPVGILISFLVMYFIGVNANIMSLGGIAIAIGVMVDASVVMVENAHKHLEKAKASGEPFNHDNVMIAAAKEVGPALFYSLVIITMSFLPVFTLQAQEGRLFRPLAYTKTFAMAGAALLAITIIPVLMALLIRGKIRPEHKNPLSRFFIWVYNPFIHFVLRFPKTVILAAILISAVTLVPYQRLGSEFIPPLYEGDFLWMPTTDPGVSITKSKEILQQTNKIIKTFPEVHHTIGKVGRVESSTDPAPLSMVETTIMLKPADEWPQKEVKRFFTKWPLPDMVRGWLHHIWPETAPARTPLELDRAINDAIQFPGLTNASMEGPIKIRLDMLTTGIRAPVGIKIAGPDLVVLQDLAQKIASVVEAIPGTVSAYPDKSYGGNYLDFDIDRVEAARYGVSVGDIQDTIMTAIGGMNITRTVEGLERYPVNLRYMPELRDDPDKLSQVLVSTPRGEHIPLGQLATLKIHKGPPAIKSENARPNAWIQVSIREDEVDLGSYVALAQEAVREQVDLPAGYSIRWSGRYEYMERARQRLMLVLPLTLLIIFFLLYMHFKNITEVFIVLLAIPFSLVGGVWLMYFLGYNMSVAVAVGFIALAGLAAETGIVMLAYLDEVYHRRVREGRMNTLQDLYEGIIEGAVLRVRPKLMTVATTVIGLLPVMIGNVFESGSEVMQRIAAPMVGGLLSATVLTLLILPAIYMVWKGFGLKHRIRIGMKEES
ncbi:MAG: efflux RND transporter permease subunit [Acidobacteria bacterium]|uniref:Efflux RND transporter permease subunit n=1 Tax=Candidatus Polarisedimenticola svalbardensis TaxID=2886004 RepID=A0A8J7CLY7_9BACT|nr:efflux RND transporter permease subunit [Candidatus Polarisedimenticola svalbardensis]